MATTPTTVGRAPQIAGQGRARSCRTPRTITSIARALLCLGLGHGLANTPALGQDDQRECDKTQIGEIPLPDGGGLFYRRVGLTPEYAPASGGPEWRQVGLYGSGQTTRPAAHDAAGRSIAESIVPIDGRIVMVSIGMSNTYQEFGRFRMRAETDPSVNANLTIINGAQGSRPADVWDSPTDATWDEVDQRLADAGLSPNQVQVAWIKHAVRSPMFPPLDFPEHPETLQTILEDVIKALKIRYPNCVLAYVSSRTRAYNTNQAAQSPEPASYENGFAVQWMIERQIAGDADLRFEGADPPAPWLSWGPYFWTDGTGAAEGEPPSPYDARSDGLIWTCADVDRDGVHPSPPTPDPAEATGEFKVGDQLMAFFLTDATTTPWFLSSTTGGPELLALTANGLDVSTNTITGTAPFTVALQAIVSGASPAISWTYGDGTFSYQPGGNAAGAPFFDEHGTPTKVFHVPGSYAVRLNARDAAGNSTVAEFPIVVNGETSGVTAPDVPQPEVPGTPDQGSNPQIRLTASPNPFLEQVILRARVTGADKARVRIHDAGGRIVREWPSVSVEESRLALTWDGTDSAGRRLSAGAYFVRIDAAGSSARTSLHRLR